MFMMGPMAEPKFELGPVLDALGGAGPRYTSEEVVERAGVEREFLDRLWRALGMALADDDEALYSDDDVESAKRVAALRAAGVPDDGILEISRVLGMTMSQLAAANREMIIAALGKTQASEKELSERLTAAIDAFMPTVGESLGYVLTLHLREQIRHDATAGVDGDGAQRVTICFADMVGFTQLGEKLAPAELGHVTGKLGELASSVVEPPLRLVKMIGDAAMLAGPEPAEVLDAAIELVDRASREGGDFPILRAGVACGEATARGGDWYGAPVNLASRITDRARPGSVLASEEVQNALADDYQWSFAGGKRLKGFDDEVKLFRARRGNGSGSAA